MSVLKTANVHFDSGGTYRIGKDGSNIVITGGDLVSSSLAPTAAYDQANAAFAQANSGGGVISANTLTGTSVTLDLSQHSYFFQEVSDNVTISFANASTNAAWVYAFTYDINKQAYGSYTQANGALVSATASTVYGISFKTDGTIVYEADGTADVIFESTLSEAWNVQTANTTSRSSGVPTGITALKGIYIKDDGTVLYAACSGTDTIYQYDLTEAWNIQSWSANGSFALPTSIPYDIHFKPDGTAFYLSIAVGTFFTNPYIRQYSLSEAWNVATSSLVHDELSSGVLGGITLSDDGLKLFVTATGQDDLVTYDLSEAWNIQSRGAETTSAFYYNNQYALYLKSDGTILYTTQAQYDLGSVPTVTLPSGVVNPLSSSLLTLDTVDFDKVHQYTFTTDDGANTYTMTSYKILS